jgi:hypothetical protein
LVPDYKPRFKEKAYGALDVTDPDIIVQAKLSGAHVLVDCAGDHARVYSYRQDRRLIQHTPKIPGFDRLVVPSALRGSMFRAELVVPGIPEQRTGGILNAGVWKSRAKQATEGRLRLYLLDVVTWRGKDVEGLVYGEKLPMLDEALRAASWLRRPRTAFTAGAKAALVANIAAGREKTTDEGVVAWNKTQVTPTKMKVKDDRDVYVARVFAENQPTKTMTFPANEIPSLKARIDSGQSVVTTRIDKEFGRWHKGAIVNTPMGVLRVTSVKRVDSVVDHPYRDQLTPQQVKVLGDQKMDVVTLASTRPGLAGGFEYALTPGGPVVGRVGTGLGHGLKAHMLKNPGLYQGLRAKIRTQRSGGAYAPQKPVFTGWHLDQQLPEGVRTK